MYNKIEIINELLFNHKELICDLAYKRDINYIKEVLKMKEWEDPKFQGLLTSTIWQSNIETIREVLKIKEWEDPKFQVLLTSNIWKSKIETIRKILNSKILSDDKYKHLLVPSIFNVSLKNVYKMIELLKEYEIDKYITNRCIRRDYKMQKVLLDYLVENNIELIVENKYQKMVLNPIINASTIDLKKKYGIDIKKMSKEVGHSRGK